MFDDDSEVDVRVLGLDLLGDFLAVGRVGVIRGPRNYVTTHCIYIKISKNETAQMNKLTFSLFSSFILCLHLIGWM